MKEWNQMSFRLSADEYEALKELAWRARSSTNSFLRKLVQAETTRAARKAAKAQAQEAQ